MEGQTPEMIDLVKANQLKLRRLGASLATLVSDNESLARMRIGAAAGQDPKPWLDRLTGWLRGLSGHIDSASEALKPSLSDRVYGEPIDVLMGLHPGVDSLADTRAALAALAREAEALGGLLGRLQEAPDPVQGAALPDGGLDFLTSEARAAFRSLARWRQDIGEALPPTPEGGHP